MPEITLKTMMIAGHLIGLCLGLGGAVLMDAIIFRFFHQQKISEDQISIFSFLSKLLTVGLIILWLTGLGFLAIYYVQDASKLANPKIWGKVSIVVILTLNGAFLHYKILPMLQSFVGHRLFDKSTQRQNWMMIFAGTVSVVSWFLPFLLGVSKELNFAVSVVDILLVYAAALTIVGLTASVLFRGFLATSSNEAEFDEAKAV